MCVAAPAYVGDDLAHQREQLRWFGGMVGNHVADLVARYGTDGPGAPGADRLHRRARGLRLRAPRQGREPVGGLRARRDRGPVLPARPGRPRTWTRLRELAAIGADQFALYLMHDQEEQTLAAYGNEVIPALR